MVNNGYINIIFFLLIYNSNNNLDYTFSTSYSSRNDKRNDERKSENENSYRNTKFKQGFYQKDISGSHWFMDSASLSKDQGICGYITI